MSTSALTFLHHYRCLYIPQASNRLLMVVIHLQQQHVKQICQEQQGGLMNFNTFLQAVIFLRFRTLLSYNNPSWLFKAIPFNHTSAHLRRELTREKVAAWCFALVGFDSAAWPQKGCILPAHSPRPSAASLPVTSCQSSQGWIHIDVHNEGCKGTWGEDH